mmetsp:Transcript_6374/g.15637  ORF Transcript_6374/g.15637 Transcript_6374/m.15637 type:complete len:169 (+) Transcript_6374:177-683(+)
MKTKKNKIEKAEAQTRPSFFLSSKSVILLVCARTTQCAVWTRSLGSFWLLEQQTVCSRFEACYKSRGGSSSGNISTKRGRLFTAIIAEVCSISQQNSHTDPPTPIVSKKLRELGAHLHEDVRQCVQCSVLLCVCCSIYCSAYTPYIHLRIEAEVHVSSFIYFLCYAIE